MSPSAQLDLEVAVSLEGASRAAHIVGTALRERYGALGAAQAVELAVAEALANIVQHNPRARELSVKAALEPLQVVVWIVDDGSPFDMSAATACLPDDPRAESGRGLWLIRHSVDRFDYERVGERNIHTLRRVIRAA